MSSLMQHHGYTNRDKAERNRGKVELLMYLVKKGKDWEKYNGPEAYNPSPEGTTFCDDAEPVKLIRPGDNIERTVPKLYRIWRKPKGMWGVWVVFQYNGKDHVPDLSVPIKVHKLPRDAEPLTDEEATKYWWST